MVAVNFNNIGNETQVCYVSFNGRSRTARRREDGEAAVTQSVREPSFSSIINTPNYRNSSLRYLTFSFSFCFKSHKKRIGNNKYVFWNKYINNTKAALLKSLTRDHESRWEATSLQFGMMRSCLRFERSFSSSTSCLSLITLLLSAHRLCFRTLLSRVTRCLFIHNRQEIIKRHRGTPCFMWNHT